VKGVLINLENDIKKIRKRLFDSLYKSAPDSMLLNSIEDIANFYRKEASEYGEGDEKEKEFSIAIATVLEQILINYKDVKKKTITKTVKEMTKDLEEYYKWLDKA
jgi:hypothetical protein